MKQFSDEKRATIENIAEEASSTVVKILKDTLNETSDEDKAITVQIFQSVVCAQLNVL